MVGAPASWNVVRARHSVHAWRFTGVAMATSSCSIGRQGTAVGAVAIGVNACRERALRSPG